MRMKKSQAQMVYEHLCENTHLTPLQAIGLFGCYRLAARINELRKEGFKIITDMKRDGHGRSYARYRLAT